VEGWCKSERGKEGEKAQKGEVGFEKKHGR